MLTTAQNMSNKNFGELFLEYPELFPARPGGETWGEKSILIDFLGGPYRFTGLSKIQFKAIRGRFGKLCITDSPQKKNVVVTRVFRAPGQEFKIVDTRDWEMEIDFDYAPDYLNMAGLRFMARIEFEPFINAAFWTPDEKDILNTSAFENLFRTIVAYRIVELGGLLLHSAGMTDGKQAWLFIGRSNAGKTTISRLGLRAGLSVLSDDMNAVFPNENGDGFVTEQLPFAGDLGQTGGTRSHYPVHGIYQLKKGRSNQLDEVPTSDRLAMMMVCAPFINTNPYHYGKLLTNLSHLRDQVPGAQLTFNIDGGFESLLNRKIWMK